MDAPELILFQALGLALLAGFPSPLTCYSALPSDVWRGSYLLPTTARIIFCFSCFSSFLRPSSGHQLDRRHCLLIWSSPGSRSPSWLSIKSVADWSTETSFIQI